MAAATMTIPQAGRGAAEQDKNRQDVERNTEFEREFYQAFGRSPAEPTRRHLLRCPNLYRVVSITRDQAASVEELHWTKAAMRRSQVRSLGPAQATPNRR